MKKNISTRIVLYSLIGAFLVADYYSFYLGVPLLDRIKGTGFLNLLFPMIYAALLIAAYLTSGGFRRPMNISKGIALLTTVFVSAYYFSKLPVETSKVHFLEYELITILVFKALSLDVKGKLVYLVTVLLMVALGLFEEIAQAIFPDRSFDLKDLKIDLLSAVLMTLFIYILRSPHRTKKTGDGKEAQT